MEWKLVPRDPVRGMDLFEQACRLGSDGGCANVAIQFLFLQEGRGFDEQIGAALARLQETCDGGDARSAYILGYAYVRGFGVPRDETRGESLLGLACERGMGDACQMLAALQGSASGGK